MEEGRSDIHPDFMDYLDFKSGDLINLYRDLRGFVLDLAPDCNELLYHTHALTSVFTHTVKMSAGFCHIPIYNEHLNLGFNKGAVLDDPDQLLSGTGKLIRHIKITTPKDYRNPKVKTLVKRAIALALEDLEGVPTIKGQTISKIKK